ncbi:MAG TPA: hypothetical protein VMW70_16695 [Burkholderiales bacterium]|nr:hypothetical protein [Burkholderiales bacterium]
MSKPQSPKPARKSFPAVAWLAPLFVAIAVPVISARSQSEFPGPLQAHFRGCESAGWCKFWIESLDPLARSLYRVYPDGVLRRPDDAAKSVAVRDRLNALLASMVHQHKRIVLYELRKLGDGTYSAVVTVNEANIASDPILHELQNNAFPTDSAGPQIVVTRNQ